MVGRAKRSEGATGKPREDEQLVLFEKKKRGGKRRGAGRPPKGERSAERHKKRPVHDAQEPVHVVLRTVKAVGSLRRRQTYQAIRAATRTVARRDGFRIVHLSIQRTHVHLLVEADSKAALASGMQGFQISAAKHLNAAISKGRPGPRRRGAVFPDRYHAVVIGSPRQARHALSYVINNWRKHAEDHGEVTRRWPIDWYASGAMFPGWKEYGENGVGLHGPPELPPMAVSTPRTWLLREGWEKHGAISCREVPSAARPQSHAGRRAFRR
ncbi:MAG: transposase [Kofleriaceae bacterium]